MDYSTFSYDFEDTIDIEGILDSLRRKFQELENFLEGDLISARNFLSFA